MALCYAHNGLGCLKTNRVFFIFFHVKQKKRPGRALLHGRFRSHFWLKPVVLADTSTKNTHTH